jgi:hypothetical protein
MVVHHSPTVKIPNEARRSVPCLDARTGFGMPCPLYSRVLSYTGENAYAHQAETNKQFEAARVPLSADERLGGVLFLAGVTLLPGVGEAAPIAEGINKCGCRGGQHGASAHGARHFR